MSGDKLEYLKDLREAVNQSSEHTQKQIQNIQSNIFLGSFLSIIIAFGISYQLKILLYWIPASFLLMYLWAIYGLISTKDNLKENNINKNIEIYKKVGDTNLNIGISCFFKNMSSIVNAVSLIYIVSLIVLVLIANQTIKVNTPFSLIIPSIAALMYIPIPFFVNNLERTIKQHSFKDLFNDVTEFQENNKKSHFKLLLVFAKGAFLLVYAIIIMLLPLLALYITLAIVEEVLFLGLVLILQFIVLVMFASYFSSQSAKRELSNTITNFADINYQINDALLSDEIQSENIERLKKLYLTAKQYDLFVDDSFKFVHIYSLIVHRVHLRRK